MRKKIITLMFLYICMNAQAFSSGEQSVEKPKSTNVASFGKNFFDFFINLFKKKDKNSNKSKNSGANKEKENYDAAAREAERAEKESKENSAHSNDKNEHRASNKVVRKSNVIEEIDAPAPPPIEGLHDNKGDKKAFESIPPAPPPPPVPSTKHRIAKVNLEKQEARDGSNKEGVKDRDGSKVPPAPPLPVEEDDSQLPAAPSLDDLDNPLNKRDNSAANKAGIQRKAKQAKSASNSNKESAVFDIQSILNARKNLKKNDRVYFSSYDSIFVKCFKELLELYEEIDKDEYELNEFYNANKDKIEKFSNLFKTVKAKDKVTVQTITKILKALSESDKDYIQSIEELETHKIERANIAHANGLAWFLEFTKLFNVVKEKLNDEAEGNIEDSGRYDSWDEEDEEDEEELLNLIKGCLTSDKFIVDNVIKDKELVANIFSRFLEIENSTKEELKQKVISSLTAVERNDVFNHVFDQNYIDSNASVNAFLQVLLSIKKQVMQDAGKEYEIENNNLDNQEIEVDIHNPPPLPDFETKPKKQNNKNMQKKSLGKSNKNIGDMLIGYWNKSKNDYIQEQDNPDNPEDDENWEDDEDDGIAW